jgi:hypothetical protein
MRTRFIKMFVGLLLAVLTVVPAVAASGTSSATEGSSQFQGWTLWGLLMLIPGIATGLVVLWLAVTAPMWRRRYLHHW